MMKNKNKTNRRWYKCPESGETKRVWMYDDNNSRFWTREDCRHAWDSEDCPDHASCTESEALAILRDWGHDVSEFTDQKEEYTIDPNLIAVDFQRPWPDTIAVKILNTPEDLRGAGKLCVNGGYELYSKDYLELTSKSMWLWGENLSQDNRLCTIRFTSPEKADKWLHAMQAMIDEVNAKRIQKQKDTESLVARPEHDKVESCAEAIEEAKRPLLEEIEEQKRQRAYYQNIVYDVCNQITQQLDKQIIWGNANAPFNVVQEALAEYIKQNKDIRKQLSEAKSKIEEQREYYKSAVKTSVQDVKRIDELEEENKQLRKQRNWLWNILKLKEK